MTGLRAETGITRQFCCYANVTECTHANLGGLAHCTPSLMLLGYEPVQHVLY